MFICLFVNNFRNGYANSEWNKTQKQIWKIYIITAHSNSLKSQIKREKWEREIEGGKAHIVQWSVHNHQFQCYVRFSCLDLIKCLNYIYIYIVLYYCIYRQTTTTAFLCLSRFGFVISLLLFFCFMALLWNSYIILKWV